MDNQADNTVKEYYWKKLCQLKFDLVYYGLHFSRCVKIVRWGKIAITGLTAITTGAWMNWNDIAWLRVTCPITIFVLQVFLAVTELLPFEDRKIDLRELIDLLDPLYRDMENDWKSIVIGKYTIEEIEEKYTNFQTKNDDIKARFLRNDSLPKLENLYKKAKEETDIYFGLMR